MLNCKKWCILKFLLYIFYFFKFNFTNFTKNYKISLFKMIVPIYILISNLWDLLHMLHNILEWPKFLHFCQTERDWIIYCLKFFTLFDTGVSSCVLPICIFTHVFIGVFVLLLLFWTAFGFGFDGGCNILDSHPLGNIDCKCPFPVFSFSFNCVCSSIYF